MKYVILVITFLVLAMYLNRAYAHIYQVIGEKHLPNPTIHIETVVVPENHAGAGIITFVTLGDSLTAGVGADSEKASYPYLVAQSLAKKTGAQVKLVNIGKPGATAQDVLKYQLPEAIKLRPDVAIVLIGINDMHNRVSAAIFQQSMREIVSSLAVVSKHVNVATIPYLGSSQTFLPPYRFYFDWQTKRYNSLLLEALPQKGINVIDLYALSHERAMVGGTYYSSDGFHPSSDGYNYWSTLLHDHINY